MNPAEFMPAPGSPAFEKCRQLVGRKLGWAPRDVMDWEVRSYILEMIDHEAATRQFNPSTS